MVVDEIGAGDANYTAPAVAVDSTLPAVLTPAEVADFTNTRKNIVDKEGAVDSPLPTALLSAEVEAVTVTPKDIDTVAVPAGVVMIQAAQEPDGCTPLSNGTGGLATAGEELPVLPVFNNTQQQVESIVMPHVEPLHGTVQHVGAVQGRQVEELMELPALPGVTEAPQQESSAIPHMEPLHDTVKLVHGAVQVRRVEEGLLPPWAPKSNGVQSKVPALRRSARNKTTADAHTLEKTARMATKKNLEATGHFQGDVLVAFLGAAAA